MARLGGVAAGKVERCSEGRRSLNMNVETRFALGLKMKEPKSVFCLGICRGQSIAFGICSRTKPSAGSYATHMIGERMNI